MGRAARRKSGLALPEVQDIEVDKKYLRLRIAAAVIFLIIGAAAIAYGVVQIFHVEKGWQEIGEGAYADFTLLYELGAGGNSARKEKNDLKTIWTSAAGNADKIFDPVTEYADVGNLARLNLHPNETVELDPALYAALELVESFGDRTIYLGPAFSIYENVFTCTEDWQIADFDPVTGEPICALFASIARYAADPKSVRVELLGENRARLTLSREYLQFLEDEELDSTASFGWMKNAFIADYLAGKLQDAGYTHAVIASFDGFVRNIDDRGGDFELDVFDRNGGTAAVAAHMTYRGAMTVAALRAFPVSVQDRGRFYATGDGTLRVPYLTFPDGLPGTSTESLTLYSRTLGCGELTLMGAGVFTGEELTKEALLSALDPAADAIWPSDGKVYCTGREEQIRANGDRELVFFARKRLRMTGGVFALNGRRSGQGARILEDSFNAGFMTAFCPPRRRGDPFRKIFPPHV